MQSRAAIDVSARDGRSRPAWRTAAAWLASWFLGIWFFAPIQQLTDPSLDTSNYNAFAYFTAHGFQFGSDVFHVGGPFGFVQYGFVYGGNLYWKRLPLELLTKVILGALVVWFVQREPRSMLRWGWLAALLFLTPLIADLSYDLAILLAGLCLLEHHFLPGWRAWVISLGLAAFLALLTLIKGTQAMLSLITFGLLALQAVMARDVRRLPWLAACYLGTLVVLLLAAGQNPLGFPRYLWSVIQQSSGYNSAMAVQEPNAVFATGLGAFLALELLVLSFAGLWRDFRALPGLLLLAGFHFLEWKHGFVRADGHVLIFFHYAAIAAPIVLLFGWRWAPPAPPALAAARAILALLAFALGLWRDGNEPLAVHRWAAGELIRQCSLTCRQLASPRTTKARLDEQIARRRVEYELPAVRQAVGNASIDFFGTAHGYLTLNRLNYRPRPMGGGNFSVFNAWLQDRNTDYVVPASGPRYFLAHPETIDSRFAAQDDPGTLRALLALYRPVETEQGMVLFERRPAGTLPAPRLLQEMTLAFDQAVDLPEVATNEMLAVELDAPLNVAGRARAFLYKAPILHFELEGPGMPQPFRRRIIPGLFQRPVILNPVIEKTTDLLELFRGGPGLLARRLRLDGGSARWFDPAALRLRCYAIPRPPPMEAEAARMQKNLASPVLNVVPLSMHPANSPLRLFNAQLVQMLEPPGAIRLGLKGNERELRFMFGIDAEAYLAGRTDGVDFLVDLEVPGQPPQLLFRRLLKPLTNFADRGTQIQRVILPPLLPPGAVLALRTEIGPDRDGAWDWAYFTGVRLLDGPYIPEQFPRFNRIPILVEGSNTGVLVVDGRDLFMLNAPGALAFALDGRETSFTATAGLLRGAYADGGRTDGVELVVDLIHPDNRMQPLARRRLDPARNGEDQGDQQLHLTLPATVPGTRLRFQITTGPAGNGAWDWSYLESIRFN